MKLSQLASSLALCSALLAPPVVAQCGAVFVLRRSGSTWVQREFLTASDSHEIGGFGELVAVDGDELAVYGGGRVYVLQETPQGFVETSTFAVDGYAASNLSFLGRA